MRSRFLVPLAAIALVGALTSCDDDEIFGLDDVREAFVDEATWVANLTSEVAGVPATATGRAFFVDRGDRIDYYLEYSGLTSNANNAHLHLTVGNTVYIQLQFVRQQSGSVIGSIDASPGADVSPQPPGTPGQAGTQTPEQLRDLLDNGGLYVNVHTVTNTGGEIRGTVTPRE
jgi:hypothetical protein